MFSKCNSKYCETVGMTMRHPPPLPFGEFISKAPQRPVLSKAAVADGNLRLYDIKLIPMPTGTFTPAQTFALRKMLRGSFYSFLNKT